MTRFKLTGEGMIDGSGDLWMKAGSPERRRPQPIAIQSCEDVLVKDLSLKNQACWGLFILYSKKVVIENLTIQAEHNIPMSDGIDLDSSKDIWVKACEIDVNDDCIAIKSGKDEDGLRVNRPSEDFLVEKCRFLYGHGGVSMESEMSGLIIKVLNYINYENKSCIFNLPRPIDDEFCTCSGET